MKPLAVGVAIILAGCSGYQLPPATPAPADIKVLATTISAIDVPVRDYYVYGTALASKACSGWFSSQIAGAAQNNLLTSELGLIGTAAGAAGGPVGAGAAAAAGFGAATLGSIQANSPGGLDPVITYGLVRKVQQAWLAAAVTPTTKAEAYMLVEDYAERCQLPAIKRAVADAVSSAIVTATTSASAQGLLPSFPRVLPPDISIGH